MKRIVVRSFYVFFIVTMTFVNAVFVAFFIFREEIGITNGLAISLLTLGLMPIPLFILIYHSPIKNIHIFEEDGMTVSRKKHTVPFADIVQCEYIRSTNKSRFRFLKAVLTGTDVNKFATSILKIHYRHNHSVASTDMHIGFSKLQKLVNAFGLKVEYVERLS